VRLDLDPAIEHFTAALNAAVAGVDWAALAERAHAVRAEARRAATYVVPWGELSQAYRDAWIAAVRCVYAEAVAAAVGAAISAPSAPEAPAGRKHDDGKRRWDLIPWRALGLVADALTLGASKHGDDGWRTLPNARRRYYAATLRHLTAWWDGDAIDHDDGLPHMAHAIADALLLLALDLRASTPEPTHTEPRT